VYHELGESPALKDKTMVLWGAQDEFIPYSSWVQYLKYLLPSAYFVLFEDCDHFIFLNRPDCFHMQLRRFLQGLRVSESPSPSRNAKASVPPSKMPIRVLRDGQLESFVPAPVMDTKQGALRSQNDKANNAMLLSIVERLERIEESIKGMRMPQ